MSIGAGQINPGRFPHPNLNPVNAFVLADTDGGYITAAAGTDINGKPAGFPFTLNRNWCPGWPVSVKLIVALGNDGTVILDVAGINQFGEAKVERCTIVGDGMAAKNYYTFNCFKRVDSVTMVSETSTAAAQLGAGWQLNNAITGAANATNETAIALPWRIGKATYGGILTTVLGKAAEVVYVHCNNVPLVVAEVTLDTKYHAVRALTDTNWANGTTWRFLSHFGNGVNP